MTVTVNPARAHPRNSSCRNSTPPLNNSLMADGSVNCLVGENQSVYTDMGLVYLMVDEHVIGEADSYSRDSLLLAKDRE